LQIADLHEADELMVVTLRRRESQRRFSFAVGMRADGDATRRASRPPVE